MGLGMEWVASMCKAPGFHPAAAAERDRKDQLVNVSKVASIKNAHDLVSSWQEGRLG